MSIFSAINTAVTGMDAQSKALENISGNVANSSTTGYKRLDTSFSDLVSSTGNRQSEQVAGTVLAKSRATNYITGDIISADRVTYMAINGPGYFVVTDRDGLIQNPPRNYYTRAGDFVLDADRNLVNSAGYFLQGYPINRATGIPADKPEPMRISDAPMPAKASTQINYQANLPSTPVTANYDPDNPIPNSQYVDLSVFSQQDTQNMPALIGAPGTPRAGLALTIDDPLADSTQFADGDTLTFDLNNHEAVTIEITAETTVKNLVDKLNSMHGVTAELNTAGEIIVSSFDDLDIDQARTGTPPTSAPAVVAMDLRAQPLTTGGAVDRTVITGDKADDFIKSSIPGDEETIFDTNGTPIAVQFRWALNGENNWTLYYNANTEAAGSQVAWKAVSDFTFDAAGRLVSPPSGTVEIPDLEVNGVSAGDITFKTNQSSLTQYEDFIGGASEVGVAQDGFPAGSLLAVSVDDAGNVIGQYSNAKSQALYKIAIATFSAEQELQRVDGAAFTETPTSGEPDYRRGGSVRAQALESSNADIAQEFSKLIVSQQAYSANSRVLSTANQMLDSVLNIIR